MVHYKTTTKERDRHGRGILVYPLHTYTQTYTHTTHYKPSQGLAETTVLSPTVHAIMIHVVLAKYIIYLFDDGQYATVMNCYPLL